jgi:hypothetical protein
MDRTGHSFVKSHHIGRARNGVLQAFQAENVDRITAKEPTIQQMLLLRRLIEKDPVAG